MEREAGIKLEWDESKRRSNLLKHGLDFADATDVLDSRYRFDRPIERGHELRVLSHSYVMGRLAVLTLVHMERSDIVRIISFRYASKKESEVYFDWLKQDDD